MIISGHGVQFVVWWWMCVVCELVEKQIKNKKTKQTNIKTHTHNNNNNNNTKHMQKHKRENTEKHIAFFSRPLNAANNTGAPTRTYTHRHTYVHVYPPICLHSKPRIEHVILSDRGWGLVVVMGSRGTRLMRAPSMPRRVTSIGRRTKI